MASGLRILNSSFLTQADLRHRMQQHLENLELDPGLCCSADLGGQGLHFYLDPDALASHAPGFDTLGLADTLHWSGAISDRDLQREILWTLLASPVVQDFPSYEEFDSASRIRFHLVRAAQRTSMDFKTDEVDRPPEHWQYHPDTGFTLKPGKSLIEALTLATQPVLSGRQYAFSCYRATEYVILLAMAQEAHDHHPDLFNRLQRQWQTRAIMSGPFQETLLREVGSQDQPLPMNWYVPGDRVWFRNPDDASSDVYGFEGSWVIYLGSGQFNNFWKANAHFSYDSKCVEVYHWRHGAWKDDKGQVQIDEAEVERRVAETLADEQACAQVLSLMQRPRDPRGVYDQGGCIDRTREFVLHLREGSNQIRLPGH